MLGRTGSGPPQAPPHVIERAPSLLRLDRDEPERGQGHVCVREGDVAGLHAQSPEPSQRSLLELRRVLSQQGGDRERIL